MNTARQARSWAVPTGVLAATLLIVSQSLALEQAIQYFPQLADGAGYITTWYFTGLGEGSADVRIQFFAQNGGPLNLPTDRGTGSEFSFSVEKSGAVTLRTTGTGSGKIGWAKVTSSRPVGALEIFRFCRSTGELISQTGVLPVNSVSSATIVVSGNSDRGTAIALANPGSTNANYDFRLIDDGGAVVASSTLPLGGGNQIATYVHQLSGLQRSADFNGTLEISSSSGFALLSLMIESEKMSNVPLLSGRSGTADRTVLEQEIHSLMQQLTSREQEFMSPSQEDLAAFSSFLAQPDTGLIRLLPKEKYDGNLLTRGGGAYFSFTRLTHDYGYGSDVEWQLGELSTGFVGADFGFFTNLGNVPIESIGLGNPAVQYLASFEPPLDEPGARQQQARSSQGFSVGFFSYKRVQPSQPETSFALRSINYSRSDVLVAIRVVRFDGDGSVILAWKMLKVYPVPQLQR